MTTFRIGEPEEYKSPMRFSISGAEDIPAEDEDEAPFFTIEGFRERARELIHPAGGVGGAVSRLGLGMAESVSDLLHGGGMLLSNILPHEMEMSAQADMRRRTEEDKADFERRYAATGGRDIYSGLGTLIPDVAMIASGAGTVSKIPAIAKFVAKTIPQKMAKGALVDALTGFGYESVKEGSVIEGAKAAPVWGAFGAVMPPLGAVAGKGFKKFAESIKLDDKLRRAENAYITNLNELERNAPELFLKHKRMKGMAKEHQHMAVKDLDNIREPIRTNVEPQRLNEVDDLLEKVYRTRQTAEMMEANRPAEELLKKIEDAKLDYLEKKADPSYTREELKEVYDEVKSLYRQLKAGGLTPEQNKYMRLSKNMEYFVKRFRKADKQYEVYFSGKDADPDRGAARILSKHFNKLPEELKEWLGKQRIPDLETGGVNFAAESGIRGGHVWQIRNEIENLKGKSFSPKIKALPEGEGELIAETNAKLAALAPTERTAIETAMSRLRESDAKLINEGRDVIGDTAVDNMLAVNQQYAPLHRVQTAEDILLAEREGQIGVASSLRSRVGSEREINDTLVNHYQNQVFMRQHFARQRLDSETLRALAVHPEYKGIVTIRPLMQPEKRIAQKLESVFDAANIPKEYRTEALKKAYSTFLEPDLPAKNARLFRENGKYFVADFKVDTVKGQNIRDIWRYIRKPEGLWKIMAVMKNFTRYGATLTPEFVLFKNPLRDIPMTMMLDTKLKPHQLPETILRLPDRYISSILSIIKDDNLVKFVRQSGGMFSQYHLDKRATDFATKELKEELRHLTLRPSATYYVKDIFKHPIRAMEHVASMTEIAPRLMMAERELVRQLGRKGAKEARRTGEIDKAISDKMADIFREGTADFGEGGWRALEINQVVPFFNAGIAGARAYWRAYKKDPGGTIGKTFALVTVPAIYLWQLHHNEDWYKNLTPMEKNLYYHLSEHVRISKPFEAGMFGASVFERALDMIADQDPEAAEGIASAIRAGFPGDPIPSGISTLQGLISGKDPFFKIPVVPGSLKGLSPRYQSKPSTSALARRIGEPLNISPVKIDWTLSNIFSGLGREGLRATTAVERLLTPEKEVFPAKELADLPGLRAIIKRSPEFTIYSGNINRFYDNAEKTERAYRDVRRMINMGDLAEARKILSTDRRKDYESYKFMNGVKLSLSKLLKLYKDYAYGTDPHKHTERQKRDITNRIAQRINELAKQANEVYGEVK